MRPCTRDSSDPRVLKSRAYALKQAAANRESAKERSRNWRALNATKTKAYRVTSAEKKRRAKEKDPVGYARQLRALLLRPYGLTPEQWESILEEQGRRCACCETVYDGKTKNWHTDHDHTLGATAVRGIVCSRCNMGFGLFDDNPAALRRAAEYLERAALRMKGANG